MLNFTKSSGAAKITYGSSDYDIIDPAGGYVMCAITSVKIPLDQLKYWSDEHQEAYVDAAASSQRLIGA